MYEARPVGAYGEWTVEFVEGRDRYIVATFGHICEPGFPPLAPERRARDYAAFSNRQHANARAQDLGLPAPPV